MSKRALSEARLVQQAPVIMLSKSRNSWQRDAVIKTNIMMLAISKKY
jgi:hypothetical protein